ncbi:MAG: hypothetical protein ACK5CA_16015 [Cyanobacteriota bacterium]|jgi:hypothetical protein
MKEAIFTLLGLVLGGGGVYFFVASKLQQKLASAERKLDRANRAMDDGEALREQGASQAQELQAAQERIKSLEASYQSQLQELEARHSHELAALREGAPDLEPLQVQIEDLQGQLETQAAQHVQEKQELELRYNERLQALEADYQRQLAEREAQTPPTPAETAPPTGNPLGGILGGVAAAAGAVGLAGAASAFLGDRRETEPEPEPEPENWVDAPAEPEAEFDSPFAAPEVEVRDWTAPAPELEMETETPDPFAASAANWVDEVETETFAPEEVEEFPLDSLLEEPDPLEVADAPLDLADVAIDVQEQESDFPETLGLEYLEQEEAFPETLGLESLEQETALPETLGLESLTEAETGEFIPTFELETFNPGAEDFSSAPNFSMAELDLGTEEPLALSLDDLEMEVPEAAPDFSLDSFDLGAEPESPGLELEGFDLESPRMEGLDLGWEGDTSAASLEAFDLGLGESDSAEAFAPSPFGSETEETLSLEDLSDPGGSLDLPADFLADMPSYHPELETETEDLGEHSEIHFLLELQQPEESGTADFGEGLLLELGEEGEELPLMDLFPPESEAALEMPEMPVSNPSDGMEPFINMLDISTETPDPELLEMLQGHHGDLDGDQELFGDLFGDSKGETPMGLEDFMPGETSKLESDPEEFSLDWDTPSS